MLGIKITGEKLIDAKFKQLESADAFEVPMRDVLQDLRADAQDYPPQLPAQRYIRTQTLQRGWFLRTIRQSTTLIGELGNRVRYGGWVMGPTDQAGVHQGRWQTTRSILDEHKRAALVHFEGWTRRIIRR